jgi:ankyrin repeat protein
MRSVERKTALMIALERGSAENVRALLQQGADLEANDNDGRSALFWAATTHRDALEKIAILIDAGMPTDVIDHAGAAPLIEAAKGENVGVVQALCRAGMPVNAIDTNGETPLFAAVRQNRMETVRYLLGSGANSQIRNNAGRRPIDVALADGKVALVNLLRSAQEATKSN